MTDEAAIIALLRLGWSERRIAREKAVHRSAIRRIRDEAGLGSPKPTTPTEVPTDLEGAKRTAPSQLPIEPEASRSTASAFGDFIEAELGKRRDATARKIYRLIALHRLPAESLPERSQNKLESTN